VTITGDAVIIIIAAIIAVGITTIIIAISIVNTVCVEEVIHHRRILIQGQPAPEGGDVALQQHILSLQHGSVLYPPCP
jgi:hypothetical protein